MSCLDNTDILRIVGGNSFQIAITVKARRVSDGSEIEDFDLSASSPVLNLIHAGEKTRKYFVTQGNQAIISFDGSEGLGYYGMEMSGSYNSEAWRFCIEKVLQLVDTNAKANIPEWSVLVDDTYFVEGTISIYGGGGGGDTVQADWTETNPTSAAFILHKPDLSVYATKTEVASGLAGKQDTIVDLADIREGAAAGATAYQKPASGIPESDMSEGVQSALDKAEDAYQLPANGIPASDMDAEVQAALEKANSAVQTETDPVFSNSPAAEISQADINNWNAKQPAIADLADIREGAAAGATAVQPGEMARAIDEVDGDIADINAKIPAAASNLNQLADKAYVNSSIATNSATYRGSFNLITDLGMNVDATHAQIAGALATAIVTADNNDYAFVQIPDSASTPTVIAKIERYKHNGSGWVYEYDLNNSGFTAAQWAAINSGITSGLVGKLADLPNNSELATLLNGKQNVINDLSAIRSGASAGATAVQPADLTEALNVVEAEIAGLDESKQDTIEDLSTIRSGAAAGATAYQKPSSGIPESDMSEGVQTSLGKADSAYQKPSSGIPSTDMSEGVQAALEKANSAVQTESDPVFSGSPAAEITQADINTWNAKQPAIGDLADIREGAAAGATAVQPDEMAQAIDEVDGDIADINAKIPAAASNLNQLADKAYVNSSIATNSATYRGSFNLITDLGMNVDATHAQIAGALATAITTADNNDYAFVQIPDSASTPTVIAKIERYKHNGSGWVYEYDLNNSGFTAAQWAAINSGITSGLVGKLSDLPNNSELATLLNGKQNVISDLSAIRSGAAAGATAIQPADLTEALNDVEAEIAGLDESKQDTIEDLSTIRSGAAAGATAYQKPGTGIPESDMSDGIQTSLGKADSAYQKPSSGIPATDMSEGVQAALEKANSAVQTETDPVFSGSPAAEITQNDINAWNAKQPAIGDLAAIREGAAAGATAVQPDEMDQAIDGVEGDIDAINAKIPSTASSLNQLADKAYVNSSIATNSATYRGSFNLITDLGMNVDATHAQIAGALATAIVTADNNDYAFVQIPDSASTPTVIAKIERYKHNGSGWVYEYDLNNSGFTAAQWAAINSGITSGLVGKLADLPNNSELATLLNGKQNVINDLSAIRSGAAAGATAYQKPSGGIPASDMSSTVQQELSKANTAVQTETDPIFSASPAAGITAQNIQTWNGEPAARQAADTALQNSVSTLQTNLAAETSARQSADAALQTAIQDEATARATADALLQQQYNALTQSDIIVGDLPETGVPNVIYRVPGTTDFTDYMWYDNQFVPMATYGLPISAEFVVDNNLNKTQEEVNEFVYLTGKNLLDVSLAVDGYVNRANGLFEVNTTAYPYAKCSPIIKVQEGKTYTISGRTDTSGIAGIDAVGNRVKVNSNTQYALSTKNGSFTVPNGVVAVQFTLVLNHALTSEDKIQLEEGAYATSYEEYYRTPINEAVLDIQSEVQHTSNEVTVLKNTNSIVLENMLGSPINVPNFDGSIGGLVSGTFNKWVGFSRYVDWNNDGMLIGVLFSGSLSSDKRFDARVSRKVRDGNTITGLVTMYMFSFILPANSSSYSLDAPLPFGKDCVLELYIDSLPTGSTLIRYKANPDASEWVRYDNQQVANGNIYNFNAVVRFFYNYQDSAQLKKIKILSLGNSHSEDAFSYVPFIVKTCFPQIDLTFGILYFGGCSLQLHEQHFDTNGDTSYIYRKILSTDNSWQTISSGTSIQSALADEDWDIIIMQQNSANEANYATFQPYLNRLIRKMQAALTKPVRFAWHFPEVPSTDYDTSVTLFGQYATNVQRVLDETPVSILFPSSAGLQNARTTALQSLGGGGNMLYTDNHAQEGIPCYCLALPNALVIADLCGLGYQGIYGDSNIPTASWVSARAIPNQNGSSVGATEDNCKIAQLCAIMAHKNPLEITDMTDLGIVSSE